MDNVMQRSYFGQVRWALLGCVHPVRDCGGGGSHSGSRSAAIPHPGGSLGALAVPLLLFMLIQHCQLLPPYLPAAYEQRLQSNSEPSMSGILSTC